jgi:peptide/nickel transport system substrate-binding protein
MDCTSRNSDYNQAHNLFTKGEVKDLKTHRTAKVAASAAIALTMCGMTVGVSHAQTILSQTSGHPFTVLASWNFPDGLNPLEPNSLTGAMQGLIDAPLAMVSRIDHSVKLPMIADKWEVKGHDIFLWINPKARWSNGAPVTAKDVKLSLEISEYYDQWWGDNAGPIKIINSHEVESTWLPTEHRVHNVMNGMLEMTPIYPASEYAKFIPSDIMQIYYRSNSKNTKVNTAASNVLDAMYKKMEKADPKTYLSCGPYVLKSTSTSEAIFTVNPYYELAPKSNFPEIEVLNSTNPNLEYAWASESRFTMGGIPAYNPKLVKQWLSSSPYHQVYYSPAWYEVGINFNLDKYPYNMLKVRQALAYLINRNDVATVADPVEASAAKYPVSYFTIFTMDKFGKKLGTLRQYRYNPKKGIALLKSAGFRQTSTGWLMPDGKPFTPTITASSGSTSWDFAAEAMAAELKKVGIHSKVYLPAATLFNEHYLKSGKDGYGMSIMWQAFSLSPENDIGDALAYSAGVSFNSVKNTYTTTPGDMVYPKLPGPRGHLYNVLEMAAQGLWNKPKSEVMATIWHLAQIDNYSLPQLQLFTLDRSVVYVDDEYYTGFPNGGTDPTSPKWDTWIDENFQGPNYLWWLETGMVHPTKAN